MTEDEKKLWRSRYRQTSEALAIVEAKELAAMTDEDAIRIIKSLSIHEPIWRDRDDWSGLVELQAIFKQVKRR